MRRLLTSPTTIKKPNAIDPNVTRLENQLSETLAAKVTINSLDEL